MIFAEDLILYGQQYNMEVQFLGNYLSVWWTRLQVIGNCRNMGFGANFKLTKDDTWILNYRLLDENKAITHQEFFDEAVRSVSENAMWGNRVEAGEQGGVITGSGLFKWLQSIPEFLGKDWKGLAGVIIILLVLLVLLPYGYKRGTS